MSRIQLEYRIAQTHIGKGLIDTPGVNVQDMNPYYSYVRHLATDWDVSKRERRIAVVDQLLENLMQTPDGVEMDLSPLVNDQRVWGVSYGGQSLQNIFTLISKYAERFPERNFYGKWGGTFEQNYDKKFIFYVDDETDASEMITGLYDVASDLNLFILAEHHYGLVTYGKFVDINRRFKSIIRDKEGFKGFLEELKGFPHTFHELFKRP